MQFAALLLFAQKGPPPEAAAVMGGMLIVWLALICVGSIVSILALVVVIMHLITEYKALNLVKPRNRTMEPGMIFLIFIPYFGLVWQFFIVIRLAESLRNEYEDRGWNTEGESFGKGIGLTAAILNVILCTGLIGLICLIVHWRQIAGYVQRLEKAKNR
jgi:hypothetical protein